jgi:hypothetical protein
MTQDQMTPGEIEFGPKITIRASYYEGLDQKYYVRLHGLAMAGGGYSIHGPVETAEAAEMLAALMVKSIAADMKKIANRLSDQLSALAG